MTQSEDRAAFRRWLWETEEGKEARTFLMNGLDLAVGHTCTHDRYWSVIEPFAYACYQEGQVVMLEKHLAELQREEPADVRYGGIGHSHG